MGGSLSFWGGLGVQEMTMRGVNLRAGSTLQWLVVSIGIIITACGVWFWVRNLPDPPRFSPLTLEPGAAFVRTPRATVEIAIEGRTVIRPVSGFEFDLAAGEAFAPDLPAGPFKLLYRVEMDLPDVTFASLGANTRDCRVRFLREDEEIRSTTAEDGAEIETGAMVFPAGASDFQIEVDAFGPSPAFEAWWRLDSDDEELPLPVFEEAASPTGS